MTGRDLLLPEDRNLQGFLYLKKYHKNLQFDEMSFENDVDVVNKVRAARILCLGQHITGYELNGSKLMIRRVVDGKSIFSSVIKETEIKNGLMEDLVKWGQEKKKFTVEKLVPSKSIIKKSNLETNGNKTVVSFFNRNLLTQYFFQWKLEQRK